MLTIHIRRHVHPGQVSEDQSGDPALDNRVGTSRRHLSHARRAGHIEWPSKIGQVDSVGCLSQSIRNDRLPID